MIQNQKKRYTKNTQIYTNDTKNTQMKIKMNFVNFAEIF